MFYNKQQIFFGKFLDNFFQTIATTVTQFILTNLQEYF